MLAGVGGKFTPASKAQIDQSDGVMTKSVIEVTHHGCNFLLWEDCEHTAKP